MFFIFLLFFCLLYSFLLLFLIPVFPDFFLYSIILGKNFSLGFSVTYYLVDFFLFIYILFLIIKFLDIERWK